METAKDLNLLWEVALYLGSGLLVALPIAFIPKRAVKRVARVWWLSPNAITLYGTLLNLLGFGIYFNFHFFSGFLTVTAGKALDRLDGRMAKARDEVADPAFPGTTDLGKVIDPLADKLTMIPVMLIFASRDPMSLIFASFMALHELIGTFLRPLPEELEKRLVAGRWAFVARLFSFGKKYARRSGATWVGKVKYCFQVVYLLLCLPEHQGWCHFPLLLMWSLLLLSGVLSFASWISRLSLGKKLDQAIDRGTDDVFGH